MCMIQRKQDPKKPKDVTSKEPPAKIANESEKPEDVKEPATMVTKVYVKPPLDTTPGTPSQWPGSDTTMVRFKTHLYYFEFIKITLYDRHVMVLQY